MSRAKRRLLTVGHSYAVALNRRLAHEIARVGGDAWDVTVAAPSHFCGPRDLRPVTLEAAPDEACRVEAMNAYLTSRVHVFFYGWRLRSLLRNSWDVVHCWEEPFILVGSQVAFFTPAASRLVYYTFQNLRKTYPFPFRSIERYSMSRAAGWISSGRCVTDNLVSQPGYVGKPMAELPLGVDVDQFRPNPSAGESIRRSLGWDADGPAVVGYLGRFVPEKGLDLLRHALDRQTAPWRALFVGAGPDEPSLRAWAATHGDRVRICNDVTHDRVPAYLNAMDFVCAPSQTTPQWKEQFGRMAIEAFACGTAFVGSDSGEIPFVTADAGLIVGERDEPGWTHAIATLIDDRGRRAELAARGLERARAVFAWPIVARRHLDFFETIL